MRQLIEIIVKYKDYITLILLCIISLSMISMGDISKIGGYRAFAVGMIGHLEEAFAWMPNPAAIRNENNAVRELNLYLSSELIDSRKSITENNKLRNLLALKETSEMPMIAAEVVGKSVIELRRYFTINKGSNDGIKRGMVARTDGGLVGTVVVVESKYSLIESLDNRNVKIASKILRTGINGILSWGGDSYFYIQNIPKSFDVQVGDELVTSNYSMKFPANIPIGKVISVKDDESSLFLRIAVKPHAGLATLEQLFVIMEINDEERVKLIEEMENRLKVLKR